MVASANEGVLCNCPHSTETVFHLYLGDTAR